MRKKRRMVKKMASVMKMLTFTMNFMRISIMGSVHTRYGSLFAICNNVFDFLHMCVVDMISCRDFFTMDCALATMDLNLYVRKYLSPSVIE